MLGEALGKRAAQLCVRHVGAEFGRYRQCRLLVLAHQLFEPLQRSRHWRRWACRVVSYGAMRPRAAPGAEPPELVGAAGALKT